MNKGIKIIIGICLALLTGCMETHLSVSPEIISCSYQGGTYQVAINCNGKWEIDCPGERITCDRTSGRLSSTINFKIEKNLLPQQWQGMATVICEDIAQEIQFIQAGSPTIRTEKNHFEISGDDCILETLYISDIETECISECDWIRIIETGSAFKKVAFEVYRNNSDTPRTGIVTIRAKKDHDINAQISVNQGKRIPHPELKLEEGSQLLIDSTTPFSLHPIFIDMTDTDLTWSSDNPETVSVDSKGSCSVNGNGSCIITASNAHHGVQTRITIQVRIRATSMNVLFDGQNMESSPTAVRYPGENVRIITSMTPAEAYTDDMIYISSDTSVATITGNIINCVSPGKTNIFVESVYQGIRKSYTLIILED